MSESLDMSLEESALGAIKISNHNMVQALELSVTGRGYDPRDFALMAFGGAGPLHGCDSQDSFQYHINHPATAGNHFS